MKFFPDKVLIGVIFIIILAISAVVFVYYRQSTKTQQADASMARNNEVLYHSAKLLAAVEESVLRARAFGLAGSESNLRQKEEAEVEAAEELRHLRRLIAKNSAQQARLDSLAHVINQRKNFSNRVIQIRRTYGRDSAIKYITTNDGLVYLDSIRLFTSHIQHAEDAMRQERRGENRNARFSLDIVRIVIIFFILILVFFMIQKVRNDIANYNRSQAGLRYNAILLNNMSDAVVSTDNDFRIKSWNKRAEDMYGWKEAEVLGKSAPDVFEVGYPESNGEEVKRQVMTSKNWQGEVIHHRKNGESFYVKISISHLYNEKGIDEGTVAVIRDITLEKLAEQQMKTFNEELQEQVQQKTQELTNVFGRVAEGFVAFNTDWHYTYVNKKAEEILNRQATNLVGHKVTEFFPSFFEHPYFYPIIRAMKEQQYYTFRDFIPELGRWFENHVYPSPDGVSIFFRDISSEIQAEIAFRESEERTRMIINSALDAIICIDTDGFIMVWNARAEKKFGWAAQEVIGKKLSDLIIPERLRDQHIHGMRRYLETGEGRLMNRITETSALRRDGTEFPIELTVVDVKQPGQNFFCAFIRDITVRVKAEAALKESEEMHRLIVETANEGIWMIDENSITTYVNEQMANILGYTRQEMIGRSMFDFIASEEQTRASDNIEKRKQGISEHHEFVLTTKGGNKITTLMGTNPIIREGKYAGALAMVIDITERKHADLKIKREKDLSDSIINSLPGIFYFFDFNGKFLRWNKNFESLSGYTTEEIKDMTPDEFFTGPDRELIKRAIQKAFISGYADTEARFMNRDGVGYFTYFSGRRIDVDGKACLIGMGIDISDLKKAQNELQVLTIQLRKLSSHLQEVREEERSMIAKEIHDELGQQLTGLKMDISWLKRIDELNRDELRDRVESVQTLLDTTINTVRRISSDLRPGMLDDLGLVDTIEWQSEEFSKRFGINVHFDSNNPDMLVPPSISLALFRVFQESLTNVARHSKATKVDVVLHADEDEIQLSISDNGIGFSVSEVVGRRTLGHVGMRERLLAVNGSFEIISEPGKGTTIFVTVPLVEDSI